MGFPISRLNLRDLAWRGALLSVAAAVVLVFLGPAVDHHFAERMHGHSHTYMTAATADHGHPVLHPFEEPHSHLTSGLEDAGHNDVLYQTSNDGLGESGPVSLAAVVDEGLAHPLQGGDFVSRALAASGSEIPEAFVAPPKRPPRA